MRHDETPSDPSTEPASMTQAPEEQLNPPEAEDIQSDSLSGALRAYARMYSKRKELLEAAKQLQKKMDEHQQALVDRMIDEDCAKITVAAYGGEYTISPRNENSIKIKGDRARLLELFHNDPDNAHMLTVNSTSFRSLVNGWLNGDGVPEQYEEFIDRKQFTRLGCTKVG